MKNWKEIVPALAGVIGILALGAPPAHAATVNSMDDIAYWVGSGTNEAALVVQWNDGDTPVSLAWGFRWNDTAPTAEGMFTAIAGWESVDDAAPVASGADGRLTLEVTTFSFGDFIDGIAYNQTGIAGFDQVTRYQTGWDWTFMLAAGEAWPETFTASDFGASSLEVENGGWYGFAYTPYVATYDFTTPEAAPAPEPTVWGLMGLGVAVVWLRRRRCKR